MKPEVIRCEKCGRKRTRSSKANRRYFALVALCVPFVYNGRRWSKREWHEYFKDLYIEPRLIELPDGRRVVRDPESSDLESDDFREFMDKVEVWCNENGLFLQEEIT